MSRNLLPIGFENQEISMLEALLTLGAPRLNRTWRIGGNLTDACILAKVDASEASRTQWQDLVQKLEPERLVALAKPEIDIPAHRCIRVRERLPGLRDLVETLNAMDNHPGRASIETALSSSSTASDRFDPAQHFVALVEEAYDRASDTYFEYQQLGIYCCPGQGAFFSRRSLEDLLPLVMAKPSEVTQKTVDAMPGFEQIKAEGWKRYDLVELRWFAALMSSQGRLHIEIDLAEPLYLDALPNWVRLPYYNEYATIAGFMASASAPAAKVAEATGSSLTEVADFANACHILKLLVRGRDAVSQCATEQAARQRIGLLCGRFSEQAQGGPLKLVFTGSFGAGKTTAISRLSEDPIMLTETRPSDAGQLKKGTTTVAMDYGHLTCANGSKANLYGTPGQRRFDFMGQILVENATAIVVFISNLENEPLAELDYYINQYRHSKAKFVIAVTHSDLRETPSVREYQRTLEASGLGYPVVAADPRRLSGLVEIFERLFAEKSQLGQSEKRPVALLNAAGSPVMEARSYDYAQMAC